MSVKLRLGKQPCPWRYPLVVPHVTEGQQAPWALVLSHQPDNVPWRVRLGYGYAAHKPGHGWLWVHEDDDPSGYLKNEILAWHRVDVPIDVHRMWSALQVMALATSAPEWPKWNDAHEWHMAFVDTWDMNGSIFAGPQGLIKKKLETGEAKAKSAHSPTAGSPSLADGGGIAITALGKAVAEQLKGEVVLPNSVAAQITDKDLLPDADVKKAAENFMGIPVHVDPALGPDQVAFWGPGKQFAKIENLASHPGGTELYFNGDDNLKAIFAWAKGGKLPMFKWPDGKLRPILLAWYFLEGPGNVFMPDTPMLTPKGVVEVADFAEKQVVIQRADLQDRWEKYANTANKQLPNVTIKGWSYAPEIVIKGMFPLAFEMGLPDGAEIEIKSYSYQAVPGYCMKAKVELNVQVWPGPGKPVFTVKKKKISV